jgi:hypothetical protein
MHFANQVSDLGYCTIPGILDPAMIEEAKSSLLQEYQAAAPRFWKGGGRIFGHINYRPDCNSPIVKSVLMNTDIADIAKRILGEDSKIISFVGNANIPGSTFQPFHTDGASDTSYLIVNIPIGIVSEHNGSTEVVPKTHKTHMLYSKFAKFIKTASTVRLNSKPGDIILRFPNVWHRGTPNSSAEVRFMLGMIYSSKYHTMAPMQVAQKDYDWLMSAPNASHIQVGPHIPHGFFPNYFKPTVAGMAKELIWTHAPMVFDSVRALKDILNRK